MNDISELVRLTLKRLSEKNLYATPANYEKEFFSLANKYSFVLDELKQFNEVLQTLSEEDKNNLQELSYQKVANILSSRVSDDEIRYFLKHLSFLMSPSLSLESKSDIDSLCTEISINPNSLVSTDTIRKLRKFTNIRIKDDKDVFTEKNNDLKKLLTFLSEFFKRRVNEKKLTLEELDYVQNEIKSLEISKNSNEEFETLFDKLSQIVDEFSSIVGKNNDYVEKSKSESESLYKQIEILKDNLNKAEEEKSIDYLTKILTRRAFEIEIDRIEKEFNVFNTKYVVIFIDIDGFKNINDTYGHKCGDVVLSTLGSILKKLTRSEDIIARYGGEEFVCILHYKNMIDVTNYIKRIKNIVNNNKFIYEGNKIDVRFSAGVTQRNKYSSYEDTIKRADELLYRAKKSGRNKIIIDNGNIL